MNHLPPTLLLLAGLLLPLSGVAAESKAPWGRAEAEFHKHVPA